MRRLSARSLARTPSSARWLGSAACLFLCWRHHQATTYALPTYKEGRKEGRKVLLRLETRARRAVQEPPSWRVGHIARGGERAYYVARPASPGGGEIKVDARVRPARRPQSKVNGLISRGRMRKGIYMLCNSCNTYGVRIPVFFILLVQSHRFTQVTYMYTIHVYWQTN